MTKQAARSIFGAVRDRDAFDSRIPRASSTITAAPTWAASFGSPQWVIRPLTAALYRSVVAAVNRDGECGNSTTGSRSASSACSVRVQRNGSAMISTTCQRRHDARMVSSTSATGTRYSASFRSGRSHTRITSKCGVGGDGSDQQGGGVVGERAVEGDDHLGAVRDTLAGGQSVPHLGGQELCRQCRWPNWHNRARRNVDSRVFGGNRACRASRCRKSSSAGLASSQQCAQSAGWSSNPAAENSRHTSDRSSGCSAAYARRSSNTWLSGRGRACRSRSAWSVPACPEPASAPRRNRGRPRRPRRGSPACSPGPQAVSARPAGNETARPAPGSPAVP